MDPESQNVTANTDEWTELSRVRAGNSESLKTLLQTKIGGDIEAAGFFERIHVLHGSQKVWAFVLMLPCAFIIGIPALITGPLAPFIAVIGGRWLANELMTMKSRRQWSLLRHRFAVAVTREEVMMLPAAILEPQITLQEPVFRWPRASVGVAPSAFRLTSSNPAVSPSASLSAVAFMFPDMTQIEARPMSIVESAKGWKAWYKSDGNTVAALAQGGTQAALPAQPVKPSAQFGSPSPQVMTAQYAQQRDSASLYGCFGIAAIVAGCGIFLFIALGLLGFMIDEKKTSQDTTAAIVGFSFFFVISVVLTAVGVFLVVRGHRKKAELRPAQATT
jgi:hypothetical protein